MPLTEPTAPVGCRSTARDDGPTHVVDATVSAPSQGCELRRNAPLGRFSRPEERGRLAGCLGSKAKLHRSPTTVGLVQRRIDGRLGTTFDGPAPSLVAVTRHGLCSPRFADTRKREPSRRISAPEFPRANNRRGLCGVSPSARGPIPSLPSREKLRHLPTVDPSARGYRLRHGDPRIRAKLVHARIENRKRTTCILTRLFWHLTQDWV